MDAGETADYRHYVSSRLEDPRPDQRSTEIGREIDRITPAMKVSGSRCGRSARTAAGMAIVVAVLLIVGPMFRWIYR